MKYIKKFWKWGFGIYHKNEEIWNYLITGAIGVLINLSSYLLFRYFKLTILISNIIAWIISVIAMYIMNKLFVFKKRAKNNKSLIKEFLSFVLARVFTLFVETAILYLGIKIIDIESVVKIIAQIVIIILNYLLSKFIIFKKET